MIARRLFAFAAVVSALGTFSACGAGTKEAPTTTSSSTTSTTRAAALPKDQVEIAGRGLLNLADVGSEWRDLGDPGVTIPQQSGGYCGGPNEAALNAGNIGERGVRFTNKQDAVRLGISTFIFPTEEAASGAFARLVASYSCGSYTTDEGSIRSTLDRRAAPPIQGVDEIAIFGVRAVDVYPGNYERGDGAEAIVRVGAQTFDYWLGENEPEPFSRALCSLVDKEIARQFFATMSGNELQVSLCVAQGVAKQIAELEKYTREYYTVSKKPSTTAPADAQP